MAKQVHIVGNWKMYKTSRQATDFLEELLPLVASSRAKIYLAVPFTAIAPSSHYARETPLLIGAQNMNDAREGAFTGEIAGLMLKEAGASFVLLGHSERRSIFKEDDAFIHQKVLRALQDDLTLILCVGEEADHHGASQTEEVLKRQIFSALDEVPKEEAPKLMLAYEPVWAIGTGKSASALQIQKAHAFCRSCLAEKFGKKIAKSIPILYGGSVNAKNVAHILSEEDVDGVLVGTASLKASEFAQIIHHIDQIDEAPVPKKRAARVKKEKEP